MTARTHPRETIIIPVKADRYDAICAGTCTELTFSHGYQTRFDAARQLLITHRHKRHLREVLGVDKNDGATVVRLGSELQKGAV